MFHDPVTAFPVGREIPYGPITISKQEIIEFAEEFDPAFFHLDEKAAQNSMLMGLSASGYHTCSLTMRMICDSYLLQSTSQGSPEAEEVNWHLPVRPGDILHGKSTVVSARFSKSRPEILIVLFRHETMNQQNELVLSMLNTGFFKSPELKHDQ
ncbi:MAG: MaoC family dehydratase [Pseudomonadota bacterium]